MKLIKLIIFNVNSLLFEKKNSTMAVTNVTLDLNTLKYQYFAFITKKINSVQINIKNTHRYSFFKFCCLIKTFRFQFFVRVYFIIVSEAMNLK